MSTMTKREKGSSYSNPQMDQSSLFPKKTAKQCPFSLAKVKDIDYKDIETLKKFTTDSGKILPRRVTGVSFAWQKHLKRAIKRARFMALLPFVAEE